MDRRKPKNPIFLGRSRSIFCSLDSSGQVHVIAVVAVSEFGWSVGAKFYPNQTFKPTVTFKLGKCVGDQTIEGKTVCSSFSHGKRSVRLN